MNVSVIIATYGADEWYEAAWTRAFPSAHFQDPRPEVICMHFADASLAEARNVAAEEAHGDWFVFLDADDELEPGYIDALRGYSTPTPDVLLVPSVRYVEANGSIGQPSIPNRGGWPKVNECVIGTAVPAEWFWTVGGFRDWPSIEDYDLWLRLWDAGLSLTYTERAVYRAYRAAGGGRNLDQSSYAAIWAEHLERSTAK